MSTRLRRSRSTQLRASFVSGLLIVVVLLSISSAAFGWAGTTHSVMAESIFNDAAIAPFVTEFNIDESAVTSWIGEPSGWHPGDNFFAVRGYLYTYGGNNWSTLPETTRLRYLTHVIMDSGVPVHHAPAVEVYADSTNEDILELQAAFWSSAPSVVGASLPGTFSQANETFISQQIANAQAFKDTRNALGLHSSDDNLTYGREGQRLALQRARLVLTDYFLAKRAPTVDAGSGYTLSPGEGEVLTASDLVDPDSITWHSNATYYNNGGGISSVKWDLNNDGVYDEKTGTSVVVTHTGMVSYGGGYSETGKTIGVQVTDDEGTVGTDTATIKVFSDPTANAGGVYALTPGTGVTLDASASVDQDSYQAGNGSGIVSTKWDLNNDGTYNEATGTTYCLTHTGMVSFGGGYSETGKTISVEVTDNEGVTATQDTLVKVFSDPTANAGGVYALTPGTGVTLDASASVDQDSYQAGNGSGIVSTKWDLNNDGVYNEDTGSTTCLTHTGMVSYGGGYSETGKTISVEVTDNEGVTATQDTLVKVFSDPTANAGGVYALTPGTGVIIDASASVDQDSYQAGNGSGIVSTKWDLNNDGTYNEATGTTYCLTHTGMVSFGGGYSETGKTISVEVTDNEGVTATQDTLVKVFSDPTVSASATYTILKRNQKLYLNGSGSDADGGGITSYAWDLDNDGQYDDATTSSPDISYDTLTNLGLSAGNTYTIGVQGTDNDGIYAGQDTDSFTITMDTSYNIAPQAIATADLEYTDSMGTWSADLVNDGGYSIDPDEAWAWVSGHDYEGHWLTLTWDEEVLFNVVTIYSVSAVQPAYDPELNIEDFQIQIWDGDSWETVDTVDDNLDAIYTFESASTLETDKLRILITDSCLLPNDKAGRMLEIEVGNYGGIQQIPEPVTIVLLALGGACSIRRKK